MYASNNLYPILNQQDIVISKSIGKFLVLPSTTVVCKKYYKII
jgi:hypothetical protein